MIIFLAVVFNYAKSKYTHIYIVSLVKYTWHTSCLSYRLQYFFISDSFKVKLYNNRLYNAAVTLTIFIVIFRNEIFH